MSAQCLTTSAAVAVHLHSHLQMHRSLHLSLPLPAPSSPLPRDTLASLLLAAIYDLAFSIVTAINAAISGAFVKATAYFRARNALLLSARLYELILLEVIIVLAIRLYFCLHHVCVLH
jgi:hypothetical protein